MPKPLPYLAFGLVASVGLNLFLLMRSPKEAGESSSTARLARDADVRDDRASCDACTSALRSCREATWASVLSTRARGGEGEESDRAGRQDSERLPDLAIAEVDPDLADQILCDVARSHLYRHWKGEQENVTASIRRDLLDDEKVRSDTARDLDRFTKVLDLSDEERARLADRYQEARSRRIARAREALRQRPVDYESLYAVARGLFADEDRIVSELFGEERERRLRGVEARKRTAILAILATYAERPWTDAVAW